VHFDIKWTKFEPLHLIWNFTISVICLIRWATYSWLSEKLKFPKQVIFIPSSIVIPITQFTNLFSLSAFSTPEPTQLKEILHFSSFKSPHLTNLSLDFIGNQFATSKELKFSHLPLLLWKPRKGMNFVCIVVWSLCFLWYL
jgi:hypothetical protein